MYISEDPERVPLYWYENKGFQIIYRNGPEMCIRTATMNGIPMKHKGKTKDGRVSNWSNGETYTFYWNVPVIPTKPTELPRVDGNRLFTLDDAGSKFMPAVELELTAEDSTFKLRASRSYSPREPIIFVTKHEVLTQTVGMGGIFMSYTDYFNEANVYLTKTGLLRAIKTVKKGDEIVCLTIKNLETFECVDLMVVNVDTMKMGKVETLNDNLFFSVRYEDSDDGRVEMRNKIRAVCVDRKEFGNREEFGTLSRSPSSGRATTAGSGAQKRRRTTTTTMIPHPPGGRSPSRAGPKDPRPDGARSATT